MFMKKSDETLSPSELRIKIETRDRDTASSSPQDRDKGSRKLCFKSLTKSHVELL